MFPPAYIDTHHEPCMAMARILVQFIPFDRQETGAMDKMNAQDIQPDKSRNQQQL